MTDTATKVFDKNKPVIFGLHTLVGMFKLEVIVSNKNRNEFGKLQQADVLPKTGPGAGSKLAENDISKAFWTHLC